MNELIDCESTTQADFAQYAIESKSTADFSSDDENAPTARGIQMEDQVELDVENLEQQHRQNGAKNEHPTERSMDEDRTSVICAGFDFFKYCASLALLALSMTIVMFSVATAQTPLSNSTHPVLAGILLWTLIVLLAVLEGGQGCIVGLQLVDKQLFVESHPWAHKCLSLVPSDKLERYIVGRQFLVVLVVFGINLCGSATEQPNSVFGLPQVLVETFLNSGLGLMVTTIALGQLMAQLNSATCMLDFLDSSWMVGTTWISLVLESCGLLHVVYVFQSFFLVWSGKRNSEDLPANQEHWLIIAWLRVRMLMSISVLGFALSVTMAALFTGNTALWNGIPEIAGVAIFFLLIFIVGLMEGIQIALFASVNMPEEKLKEQPVAYANCQLVFDGSNFEAFLIGRQICVTICMFLIARITMVQMDVGSGDEKTLFGVPDGVQKFFNTGFLGAIITTILGSLVWRVLAASFPLAFLSNPLAYFIIWLCLALDATGFFSAARVCARVQRWVAGLEPDGDKNIWKSELDKVHTKDFDVQSQT